ncbi:putative sterigmatocystin biosynthesis monooxygenase stcW [Fonsecaea pedrosoi]|nr:putative sterigmatocystin biosynthesis monooxygenase stcW [Fonsecaea pedrosoi]
MDRDQREPPPHTSSNGYFVPDVTYLDPGNRRMRIVTIGAGFSGIMYAYRFQNELENVEHVIYEKNGDIVPSHSYVYNFALNPYWSELYSSSDSIWKYLDRVCRVWDLRKYMQFNSRVIEATWNEDLGKWMLKVEQTYSDESTSVLEDECDVLIQATGMLNNPKLPQIQGLGSFKGRVVHTAQWPDDFTAAEWTGKKIVIVGAGSSSIQATPGMQPYAKELHVFIRSKSWLASVQPNYGLKPVCEARISLAQPQQRDTDIRVQGSQEEQESFARDHAKLVSQARVYEAGANRVWKALFKDSPEQEALRSRFQQIMRDELEDETLVKGLVPDFAVGCRRTSPGRAFMQALKKPNVFPHFTALAKVRETSVIGADGSEIADVDAIVLATGFDTTYLPRFNVVGMNGVSLRAKFTPNPDSYLGIGVPDFPNFILTFGPTFPVLTGSVTASISAVADYAIQMIKKIQAEDLLSVCPRQDVTDQFNEHCQTMLHGTVWEDHCNSWYKRPSDGRITAVWPGSALHFQEVVRHPRWEDFHIKSRNKLNMWAFLGRGFTRTERDVNADIAPYMNVDNLDLAFYDYDRFPLRKEAAPTPSQAREQTLRPRPEAVERNGGP